MSGSFLYMFVSLSFAGEGGTWNFAGQWGPTLPGSSTSWAVLRGSTWEAWLKHAVLWRCSGTDSIHSPLLDTFSHCGWRPIFSILCGMRILSYPWTDSTFVPEL
uniref:Secreted protein n=2 Tax=Rhinopithecus TaxID=542827 RepID=A0A2K6MTJ7_RHIBE